MIGAECTGLFIVPRALLCQNATDQGDWILPGQKFFPILYATTQLHIGDEMLKFPLKLILGQL